MSRGTLSALLAAGLVAAAPPTVTIQAPPPIVTVPLYQDWAVDDLHDYVAAHTRNDSGSIFGLMCGASCVVYLNMQITCNNGEAYPAMINAATGSYTIELRCYNLEGRYILTTPLTDAFVTLLGGQGEVGFAVPLQSGRFSVSRFSLNGCAAATGAAVRLIQRRRNEGQQGLRDFTI